METVDWRPLNFSFEIWKNILDGRVWLITAVIYVIGMKEDLSWGALSLQNQTFSFDWFCADGWRQTDVPTHSFRAFIWACEKEAKGSFKGGTRDQCSRAFQTSWFVICETSKEKPNKTLSLGTSARTPLMCGFKALYGNKLLIRNIWKVEVVLALSAFFVILWNLIFKRQRPNCVCLPSIKPNQLMRGITYQSASSVATVHSYCEVGKRLNMFESLYWKTSKKVIIMVFERWTKYPIAFQRRSRSSRLCSEIWLMEAKTQFGAQRPLQISNVSKAEPNSNLVRPEGRLNSLMPIQMSNVRSRTQFIKFWSWIGYRIYFHNPCLKHG